MNSQDQEKFKNIIAIISETYSETFTASKAQVWWNVFKPYPINLIEKALYDHIASPSDGMFSPKPAHIIKHITGDDKDARRKVRYNCALAWADVVYAIKTNTAIDNSDDCGTNTWEVVGIIGGLGSLKQLTTKDLEWKKKEFIELMYTLESERFKKVQAGNLALEQNDQGMLSHE